MTHKEKAQQLLQQQYHCSQALFGAFAEDFGLDIKTALRLSTCFGGGMREGGTCGCITAALLVLGLALGFYDAQDRDLEVYGNKKTQEFIHRFQEQMDGHIYCRDILGKNIALPEDMAVIRQEKLILKKCPRALNITITLLEEMLSSYLKDDVAPTEDILSDNEMHSVMRNITLRRKFRRNVNTLLHTSARKIGFIQFDIHKFKLINDLYGERFGDQVLDFVTEQLHAVCQERQYYVNLRSDVFMIATEFDQKNDLLDFIHRLDGEICAFRNVKLRICYGVYTIIERDMELRQMEDRATMARKVAKKNVLNNICFYRDQLKDSLYSRKFIEENMQAAVSERQFMMYLQPKYSIAKNEIIGAEALIRWRHPERGMIFPDQFIPVIEENGFIKKVDYFIWTEACRFLKRCQEHGLAPCPVSVNVSRFNLKDNECIRVLSELIEHYAIPKRMLELEITETADNQSISMKSVELKEHGFTLLMDDFGSGYSSLNILLETPFDVIKLDKKFIENMLVSRKGRLILEQVVAMANKLGLGLFAEGVETREQVELLQQIGCDQVQGYYYAKPMPQDEFFSLLVQQQTTALQK